jgi:hypothetical protein
MASIRRSGPAGRAAAISRDISRSAAGGGIAALDPRRPFRDIIFRVNFNRQWHRNRTLGKTSWFDGWSRVDKFSDEHLEILRKEFLRDYRILFTDDNHKDDHEIIMKWIWNLLNKTDRSDEDEFFVHSTYHCLTSDIPIGATASIRREFLEAVRMKISDPTWLRFPPKN